MRSTVQSPRSLNRFPLHFSTAAATARRHVHTKPLWSSQHVNHSSLTDQSASPSTSVPQSQILSIRQSLLSRQFTVTELAESYLTRLRLTEPHLNSFLHISETVLGEAQEIDDKIKRNEEVGPLAGVLMGVKDNICTANMPSTGGSRVLESYKPPFDSTAVSRVKQLGGIVVGKPNMDEFGMGSTTDGSAFQCVVSLGSDTGGSVRQPASFCGDVGLKPPYGRVSRYGLMPYASSLDVIGCFGCSVADAGILLNAISGHDKLAALVVSEPLMGLRVGLIRETFDDGVDAGIVSTIHGAASHLEELGCVVTEVSLPSFALGLPAYYILASSESSSNLSRYDGVRYGNQVVADEINSLYGDSRAKGFGPEVKRRILMGTYALSAGYYQAYSKRAQQVRTIIQKSLKSALEENDILISPAAPSATYKIGEKKNDPLAMYAGDIMTTSYQH